MGESGKAGLSACKVGFGDMACFFKLFNASSRDPCLTRGPSEAKCYRIAGLDRFRRQGNLMFRSSFGNIGSFDGVAGLFRQARCAERCRASGEHRNAPEETRDTTGGRVLLSRSNAPIFPKFALESVAQ